jgi:hypothetical protein
MRLGLAALVGLLGFAPNARAAVSINVGSATGSPGNTVMFFVALTTTAGEQVAGTQITVDFKPETPAVQCTPNPSFAISQCALHPTGCTPGVDCLESACFIAPFGGTIPSGSQLYFCNVKIAGDAAGGDYPLHCSYVDVRDSGGNSLNPQCTDGQVHVIAPTPTPTATPTPTSSPPGSTCVGDCSDDYSVTVGDANGDDEITIDEILTAVNNALNGCPHLGTGLVEP